MRTRFLIKLPAVVLAAVGALLTSGCWPAHPHDPFRTIHQCAINGDLAGATDDLARSPDDANLPEKDGVTPLHLAAQNCHTNVMALLLDKGAKIDATASDHETPLHLAAQEGCADAVNLLLAKGAKVNERDDQKRTPLVRAEQWHQDAIVQLLKAHGGIE